MTVDYSLYQPDIFDYFRAGYRTAEGTEVTADSFFRGCIALACRDIAQAFDCTISLSVVRLQEARVHWVRDVGRIEIDGGGTPNHFKQCGFLAYWLRRRIVVQQVARAGAVRSSDQDRFVKFSNEICVFLIAFRIAAYFQFQPWFDAADDASVKLAGVGLDRDFIEDMMTLLKHKNVSPHSLYLVLAALFVDIRHPRSKNVVKLVRS